MQRNLKTKHIPKRYVYTVFGYLRQQRNDSITIPAEIMNIILLFYYIHFKFYTKEHGNNIIFIENKIVKLKQNAIGGYSTCLFGVKLTDKICNKCDIHIKINDDPDFVVGYVTSYDCIKSWDTAGEPVL